MIAREDLDTVLQTFGQMASRHPDVQRPRGCPADAATHDATPLRIAVVGEIKKGKSSLLNALAGVSDLTPVSSDIATSVVFRLHHGPSERVVVEFHPDENERPRPAVTITRADVPRYGTEDANPGNRQGVDSISLGVPSPFLGKGFELLDTPGLGGLFASHAEVTWKHVPRAHLIMFVVDSVEAVMSRHEADYLAQLHKLGKPVFFVQTKIDAADAEMVEGWRKRNLEIIRNVLQKPPEQIPYFCVSSQLWTSGMQSGSDRQMKRSGMPTLFDWLNKRLEAFRQATRTKLLGEIDAALVPAFTRLKADAEAARSAANGGDLKAQEQRLTTLKRDLADWQAGDHREATRNLQQDLAELRRVHGTRLRTVLGSAPGAPLFDEFARKVEALGAEPRQAQVAGPVLLDDLSTAAANEAYTVLTAYERGAVDTIQTAAERVGLKAAYELPADLQDRKPTTATAEFSHEAREQTFAELFTDLTALTGSAGALAMLGVATGGAALLLGGIVALGVRQSRKVMREDQEAKQIRAKLAQAAQALLRATSTEANNAFEETSARLQRDGGNLLEECLVQRRREVSELERAVLAAKQNPSAPQQVESATAAYRDMLAFRQQLAALRGKG